MTLPVSGSRIRRHHARKKKPDTRSGFEQNRSIGGGAQSAESTPTVSMKTSRSCFGVAGEGALFIRS